MKHYDPDLISIVFAGILIEGYADGEFVSIEANSEDFLMKMGTDGEGTRSKTNDRSGTVTLKLMQSSSSNPRLSAIRELDLAQPNGAGVGALQVRDQGGVTIYSAEQAYIEKLPSSSFDREATTREWVLKTDKLTAIIGGN